MKQRSLFSKPRTEPPKPVTKRPAIKSENYRSVENNPRFTNPFLAKSKLKNPDDVKVYELIQRHRLQLLVWSKLYYDMSTSVVEDSVFDKIGRELVVLQNQYPDISKLVAYHDEFKDWDATTGFHLPLNDPWVCRKAEQILEERRRRKYEGHEN